jgi:hypothetical protein
MRINPMLNSPRKLMFPIAAVLSLGGCMLFIHDKSPIASVADADREVVQPGLNEPDEIKLTKPAKVAGIDLAAGSVIKHDGESTYRLITVGPAMVGKLSVPAGSAIEMKKADGVDRWNWTGVILAGATATYNGHEVQPGDRVVFAAELFSAPSLMQFQIEEDREVRGKPYPKGTLFDVDRDGKITGAYTPETQAALGKAREQHAKERAQREKDCKVRCSVVTDFHENAKCMGNCRN